MATGLANIGSLANKSMRQAGSICAQFQRAKADVVSFIRANHRLPPSAWIGSERLSLADFTATLAADHPDLPSVAVHKGNPEMECYIATDAVKAFNWVLR